MRHLRKKRQLAGKVPIKKANTLLANIGAGSAPGTMDVLITEAGSRSLTGATQTIKESANTAQLCNVGDTVKYVTLYLQASGRPGVATPNDINGWIEWAFVCVKESETALPITNLGILTLGNVAMNMYRNECIYTGIMPIGQAIPNSQEIKIKIPRQKQQIRIGDEWRFITSHRSNNSTDVSTSRIRLVKSFSYKCYS